MLASTEASSPEDDCKSETESELDDRLCLSGVLTSVVSEAIGDCSALQCLQGTGDPASGPHCCQQGKLKEAESMVPSWGFDRTRPLHACVATALHILMSFCQQEVLPCALNRGVAHDAASHGG